MLREIAAASFGALISMSFCSEPGAADVPPSKSKEQTLKAHVLIVGSYAEVEEWVLSAPSERGGDHARLRNVSRGTRIYLPIVITGFKPSQSGAMNFSADLELVDPNGKSAGSFKRCCSAVLADPKTPGLVVLNPVKNVTFDSTDSPGTYTVQVTVTDGARSATARETFRLQADAAADEGAVRQGDGESAK